MNCSCWKIGDFGILDTTDKRVQKCGSSDKKSSRKIKYKKIPRVHNHVKGDLFMHYSPQNEECPMALNPFKACVAPRPIGWISTVSRDGIHNLAPFSQFQNLSYDPPMVMIAIN